MIEGYDVSKWQTETPDLTNVGFVIVRACYGASEDSKYAMHAANVRAADKVLGAYMFARPVTTGDTVEEQVATFLRVAKDADLIAIDREKDGDAGVITATDTRRMISLIRATGRRVGLYASESVFRDYGQDWSWVANWSREPAIPWDVWQWEGGGTDKLDNNRFAGTIDGLLALGAPIEAWVDAKIAALEDELEASQTALVKANALLVETQRSLDATQAALDQANAHVAALTAQLDRLVAELDESQKALAAEQKRVADAVAVMAATPGIRAWEILTA